MSFIVSIIIYVELYDELSLIISLCLPFFYLSRATFIGMIRFDCLCGLLDRCLSGLMCTTIA